MKTAAKIALIAWLWIIVINPGTYVGLDTSLRLQMAHAWWTGTEEVSIPPNDAPKVRGDIRFGVSGEGDERYISFDVGQSLLMLPGDWVGTQLHRWFPALALEDLRHLAVQLLVFVPLNVATVVSGFWLLRLFGFEERIAALTSLTWLLGTTVFHYAQIPQQNNQLLLFVTIGYAAALAFIRRGRPQLALGSGLALGGAFLIRFTSVFHVLTVLLFLVGCVAYQSRDRLKVFKAVRLWIAGFMPLFLLSQTINYVRYGSFWVTGKIVEKQQQLSDPMWSGLPQLPPGYPLLNPPHVGILDTLFSPARSIFIYDPFLIPCLILGIVCWKKFSPYMQWYLICGIFNLGLHMALTSRLIWHGGTAWGSRFHVTSVHLLLIPLLAFFIQVLLSTQGWTRWLLRGIVAVAIAVQITSVTMEPNLEIYQTKVGMPGSRLEFRLGQRLTNIACLANDFSERCIDRNPNKRRYVEEFNNLFFLPFNFHREAAGRPALERVSIALFVAWGLALVMAISTTTRFVFGPG
ncbi:glycosyltransferase family 39 protein [Romeria aff. gracilis LEGE 07310]|uniref:Glycosyltransferase family 39 protein n=1 Tax=Vasconcelosia minhoensis LEGE 07310 TaxID=915328 RepID=A0A8J7AQC8_9CYAN|nr:glycosyltransferase family 39 protein [Romeria gracilis]MBE9078466.1 glycosyltransferase family 39 protein [Romeria aff. gracilis LEGE 07310]